MDEVVAYVVTSYVCGFNIEIKYLYIRDYIFKRKENEYMLIDGFF